MCQFRSMRNLRMELLYPIHKCYKPLSLQIEGVFCLLLQSKVDLHKLRNMTYQSIGNLLHPCQYIVGKNSCRRMRIKMADVSIFMFDQNAR